MFDTESTKDPFNPNGTKGLEAQRETTEDNQNSTGNAIDFVSQMDLK